MLQRCVGLNQELNFDYIQELKALKMHQATCGKSDVLANMDEKKLKQRRKELKAAKRKQKEEYKKLKDVEDAGLQELNSISSSIGKLDADIQAALEREKQVNDQRAKEGESGWQAPINDPCYGNLESPTRVTKEGCQRIITAQDEIINTLNERIEKERERHGVDFERRMDEIRLQVIAHSSQMRADMSSECLSNTPGGGEAVDHSKEKNTTSVDGFSEASMKEFHGLELLGDGSVNVQVDNSTVTVSWDDAGVLRVRSKDGTILREVECSDRGQELGSTFADVVHQLRIAKSDSPQKNI